MKLSLLAVAVGGYNTPVGDIYKQGGGGACFQGLAKLEQNDNYAIRIGNGGENGIASTKNGADSYLSLNGNRLITAGGGHGGGSQSGEGDGGTITVNRELLEVKSVKIEQNGNKSTTGSAGGQGLYIVYNESGTPIYCGNGGKKGEYGISGFGLINLIYIEEQ